MVLKQLGGRFEKLRKGNRVEAFEYLQSELMNQMETLVPNVISMKDLLSTVKSLQEMIAATQTVKGESPVEYLKNWLNAEVA